MDAETHGYASGESPNNIPQPITTSPSNAGTPQNRNLSFADVIKNKGKGKEQQNETPLLHHTWCKLREFEDSRIPPVTDAKFSVWLDMQEVYEDQGAIYSFVAQNPNIATLSFRPSQKWVEFYCKSEEQVKTRLGNEWMVGSTNVKLV